MDKFLQWIEKHKKHRALTDSSYKKVYQERYGKNLNNTRVNTELATYGDAVLKLALCEILWKEEKKKSKKQEENTSTEKQKTLSECKQDYESDEILVKVIAKHYDILQFLRFDTKDDQKPKDYKYTEHKNSYKYIATAIEACLGAMYMDENVSWRDIIEIVKGWKNLIDANN